MNFVIYCFILFVVIFGLILFTDLFNKLVKAIALAIAAFASGSALTILINKIGLLSGKYTFPFEQYRFYTIGAIALLTILSVAVKGRKKA
ncbi:MAG: hypothetical protein PHI41_06085 [Erysipelotrichaceae bacterium]|nr:hypothetical protein [Erysipelotrichaceae bacterium]MDD3810253.1 hypothetical protein [Erysipelotrichaceae bacterium]